MLSPLLESVLAGQRLAEEQVVHVMGTFISVDGLKVDGVPHYACLQHNAHRSVDLTGSTGDSTRLVNVIALSQADLCWCGPVFILEFT